MITLESAQISLIWALFIVSAVLMTKKWQLLVINKHGLTHSKMAKKYPYKEPILQKPGDDDLSKQWAAAYDAWSEQQEKIIRKRVILSALTRRERLADAKEITALLEKELVAGAYVEPVEVAIPIVSFKTDLSVNMPIYEAVDYFLKVTHTSLKKASRRTYKSCANAFRHFLAEKKMQKLKLKLFSTPQAYQYTDYLPKELQFKNRNFNKHHGFMVTFFEFFLQTMYFSVNLIKAKL